VLVFRIILYYLSVDKEQNLMTYDGHIQSGDV
jgi:hypothetical protein